MTTKHTGNTEVQLSKSFKAMAADKNVNVKKTDLYLVDPRLLIEEENFNLRDYDDPDVIAQIEAFAQSYAAGHFVPPLIVRTTGDGRIAVVEGHCRRRGALLAISRGVELDFVQTVPFRGSDIERTEVMLRSAGGLKLKPLKVAFGYLRLSRMGHSNQKIADSMSISSARVEQMLLIATANSDVHDLISSGSVAFDAAIEAVRDYQDQAGKFLMGKLEEAKGQGKSKVTRGTMRGPSMPPKVVSSVIASMKSVVTCLDKAALVKLAEFESLEPEQLKGKTIPVDVSALLELFQAHNAVNVVVEKREKAASAAEAAASQQELSIEEEK